MSTLKYMYILKISFICMYIFCRYIVVVLFFNIIKVFKMFHIDRKHTAMFK